MPLTEIVSQFEQDIKKAKHDADCDSCIVVLLGPPLREFSEAMQSLLSVEDLEQAIAQDRKNIVPSPLVYALAGIRQGCAILDFTANKTLEIRALVSLAERCKVPIAGRDGSTGQTYLKHGIATLLGMRGLAIKGWYSANILGNQDGYVLNMPEFAVTKMQDKTAALNKHCGLGPDTHVVDISYYRPRGDNKESWDSIDFTGWFDLPMQLKLNWLGRDSILAGPLLLDLCRLLAYELKAGTSGIQSHLAFYFKCPLGRGIPYSPFEQINLLKKRFNL
jgi:myo-inositol-1-phosphate synthase